MHFIHNRRYVFPQCLFLLFSSFRTCFGVVGVSVKQIVILNIGFGFCVFKSIWEHASKICFDIVWDCFQTCSRSVNNSRTNCFFEMFEDFGAKWSPYVAEASLGRGYNVPDVYLHISISMNIYIYKYTFIFICVYHGDSFWGKTLTYPSKKIRPMRLH